MFTEELYFTIEDFESGYNTLLDVLPDLLIDTPLAANYVGYFIGIAFYRGLLPWDYLEKSGKLKTMIKSGYAEAVVGHCVKTMYKQNMIYAKKLYSTINLLQFLKPGMNEEKFLINYDLKALCPIVHCKLEVSRCIEEDETPQDIIEMIKQKFPNLEQDVNLMKCLMGAILNQLKSIQGYSFKETSPEHKQKEKELFSHYLELLQHYINEKNQSAVLVEIYYFCNEHSAKGLLVRVFDMLYKNQVISSWAITEWMETVKELPNQVVLGEVKEWWNKVVEKSQTKV